MVVIRRRLVERSSNRRDIDVNDLLGIRIIDGAEIERVGVLAVIDVWAVVH